MNYIKKLQQENTELKRNAIDANDAITDLYVYLMSNKFRTDTTVQVKDVMNRLDNIKSALFQP